MDIAQAKMLLLSSKQYKNNERKMSVFELGGRGYYENPTTDLLAFFLNPQEIHGLGDIFLRALLDCLPEGKELRANLIKKPQREVYTENGKRIDLILLGDGWSILLENKILHSQINPFDDYEQYFYKLCQDSQKKVLYVVLSPSGISEAKNWIGLKYQDFIHEASKQLVFNPVQNTDRWQLLASEFLLHLSNHTLEHSMDNQAFNFVFENLPEIIELKNLHEQAINYLDNQIIESLKQDIPDYNPYKRRHTWSNGLALRYACNDWSSWSDVVLYLEITKGTLQPKLYVYLCDVDNSLAQLGREMMSPYADTWSEKTTILGFKWSFKSFNQQEMIQAVVEKMQLLMAFEQQRWEHNK